MEASATTATNVAPSGLSAAEAQERRRRGEANTAVSGTTRGYGQILRSNVFSFFNTILFVIGIALLVLGRYSDAFTSVGLGLVNAVISAVQEIRAKRKLDRLQLLDRAAVTVVRDGREVEVAPEEVVRGDVLRVRAGDQIVVDGPLLDGRVEADESLLTGESDPVVKDLGDELRSGSLCVAGDGHQLARDVGAASYAGRLTAEARRVTTDATPLQRRIAFVVRLVIALTVLMSGAILAQAVLEGFSLLRTVQITAVLSGLVPYGLFFLIAVAYTAGAGRIAGCGALVQQVNAVESVSNVDVVCTDKTGTLTTGRLTLDEVDAARRPDRGGGGGARRVRPQRQHPEPHHRGAGRGAARARPGPSATRCRSPRRCAGPGSSPTTARGCWVHPTSSRPTSPRPLPDDAVTARTSVGLRVLVLARVRRPVRRAARRRGPPAAARPRAGRDRRARRRAAPRGRRHDRPVPRRTASRSRCSPATTPAPSPRSPPAPGSTPASRCPAPRSTASTTPPSTGSSPAPPCSAGSPPSTRNGSSRRCAGRATTSR